MKGVTVKSLLVRGESGDNPFFIPIFCKIHLRGNLEEADSFPYPKIKKLITDCNISGYNTFIHPSIANFYEQ
ncbi:hypothetical protein DRP05_09565 [Archaeoglobales archaeon]|nr:MAG: hypothetical protein DRP05_09565 [Archaeoglobales archaeon]